MTQVKLFFLLLILCLLTLPAIQMQFAFFEEEKLHGVEQEQAPSFPEFSFASIVSERFQHSLSTWFSRRFGFRGHLVRTDNQLNYSIFRMLSADYASPILLGKANMLFERLYIDAYNMRGLVPNRSLERIADRLATLQELLKKRNIEFLLLITPSKATIYPENIPEKYLTPRAQEQEKSNYSRFLPILDQAGVKYFDTRAFLEHRKASQAAPLFAKGGTHWTQQTACSITQELVDRLRPAFQEPLPTLPCDPTETKLIPDPFDRDLADLANLWYPEVFYEILPYPITPQSSENVPAQNFGYQPRLVFSGGSFLWTVLYYLEQFKVTKSHDMLYYFSRNFRYPSGEVSPINRQTFQWDDVVFNADAVILEVNEANIDRISLNFINDATAALQRTSSSSANSAR